MRETYQYHTFMEFPPNDTFGIRIYLSVLGEIEIFSTEFQESFEEKRDDALGWIEYQHHHTGSCELKYVATLDIEEFIARMKGFLSCLEILDKSQIPLDKRHVYLD